MQTVQCSRKLLVSYVHYTQIGLNTTLSVTGQFYHNLQVYEAITANQFIPFPQLFKLNKFPQYTYEYDNNAIRALCIKKRCHFSPGISVKK